MIKIIAFKFIEFSSIAIMIISLLVVIGWTTNIEFFQFFSKESTYTSLLCSFFVLFTSLWNSLNVIHKHIGAGPLRKSLAESLQLQCSIGKISNLSICAVTTGKILPIISSSQVQIDSCTIILPLFDKPKKGSKEDTNNARCDEFIAQWRDLERAGRIKKLKILRSDHWPDLYVCIADKNSLVSGFYNYSIAQELASKVAADFSDSIFIKPTNESSRQLFYFYYDFFERLRSVYDK